MISFDTECGGLDTYHGATPFFVTICREDGSQHYWEWSVDPLTRKIKIPEEDKFAILKEVEEAGGVVGQNIKFDVSALYAAGMFKYEGESNWPWEVTDDTLLAAHLLASNQPKDLSSLALHYLGCDIEPYEMAIKKATQEARRKVRSEYPEWRIASNALREMPSAKGECWKYDMWLPRAYGLKKGYGENHPWMTALRDYSNTDSAVTLALWKGKGQWHGMETELKDRRLWQIYLMRRKLPRILFEMEHKGVTVSKCELERLEEEYDDESERLSSVCIDIASLYGYNLNLPRGGVNNSLREFIFDRMRLQPIRNPKSKTLAPTLDKKAIDHYVATLPSDVEGDNRYRFIVSLRDKRKRDTALTFLDSYRKFWLPLEPRGWNNSEGVSLVERVKRRIALKDWYVLHPSINPTGTDTLRMSSSNPNSQQVAKQGEANLRPCFGPAPGREWWKFDAENIELRIPAYEAGEKDLIYVFDHPNDPPYYGSQHLVTFELLYPQLFKEHGKSVKKLFDDTYYQWTKNGTYCKIYGGQEALVDATFHVVGADKQLRYRFPKIAELSVKQISLANKYGYVETIVDRELEKLGCTRGYPLLCTRSEYGKILPTVPLNYHIQGTACYWMCLALITCQEYLDELNSRAGIKDYHMILQVHDELVFDFPYMKDLGNLAIAKEIQKRMASCGDRIGVPTPVSCELHSKNWSEGVAV